MKDNGTIIATTNYFTKRLITGTPIGFVRDGNAVNIYFCDHSEAIEPLRLHIVSETIGNRLTDGQKELVEELIDLEINEEFFGFRANEIKKELGL